MPDPAVWLCIPSARADGGTIRLWKERGYRVAVQRDPGAPQLSEDCFDVVLEHEWDGYPKAVNRLCKYVLQEWTGTLVCVTGGDDIEPDPTYSPREIQQMFLGHLTCDFINGMESINPPEIFNTYGVMQPTGDPWSDSQGRIIERIAGSPWMGRDWILKSYGGNGPIFEGFYHFYEDEALQEAAKMQGVFWQRPDIVQKHNHWTRDRNVTGADRLRPVFLNKAQAMWEADKQVFLECKARNFSESLPR